MVFPEEVGAMTSTFWRSNRPLLLMAGAAERYQAGGRRRAHTWLPRLCSM